MRVRAIGQLPDETQARRFGDFLLVKGIQNQLEAETDGSWLIWVADDDQIPEASEHLARFKSKPDAEEFISTAAQADTVRAKEKKAQSAWRRRVRGRQEMIPAMTAFRPGMLTFILICLCGAVAFVSKLGDDAEAIRGLFISYFMPAGGWFIEVKSGQLWRLFTPMLIHFGFAHLLFNMMWLFRLGSMIEHLHGAARFALLVLAIAGGSNVAQYLWAGPAFGGMSGVNYGLFGYVWLRGKFDPSSGLFITQQDKLLMLGWFALGFTGWVGPIANVAHTGGLVIGAAWGWLSAQWAMRNR